MDVTQILIDMLPYLIVAIVVYTLIQPIINKLLDVKSENKERETKTTDERIFNMIVKSAKNSDLKKGSNVYVKGDENVPAYKIGKTATGILVTPEVYVLILRPFWWIFPKPWADYDVIFVEREFVHDLYKGDIMIENVVGLDPITEKFTWVTTSQGEGFSKYDGREAQRKMMKFFEKLSARILDVDTNNDIVTNPKAGLRGSRMASEMEEIRPEKPTERDKKSMERERYKREQEIRKDMKDREMFDDRRM